MIRVMTVESYAPGYALLDAGDGRRLERFADRLVDRAAPGAGDRRRRPELWGAADLRFDRSRGWSGRSDVTAPWSIELAGLTLELRATDSGGVGLFPEQLANATWLANAVSARAAEESRPAILNLFAHTGLLTLVAARAGAAVTHVDAARGAVAWARRNAELSALADRPIRWIVDDALEFVRREARRGRRFDGIVLDPPSYGHGGSRPWRIETDLPELLDACNGLVSSNPFVLLTGHTTGVEADRLDGAVREAFPMLARRAAAVPLELAAESGAVLRLGTAIRAPR
jgi:23S rRNA (cytosine1962-C5)-methyltransferase